MSFGTVQVTQCNGATSGTAARPSTETTQPVLNTFNWRSAHNVHESPGLAGEVQDGQRFAVEVAYVGLAAVGYQRNAGWTDPGRDGRGDPVGY
jgi:hypothetical protein